MIALWEDQTEIEFWIALKSLGLVRIGVYLIKNIYMIYTYSQLDYITFLKYL